MATDYTTRRVLGLLRNMRNTRDQLALRAKSQEDKDQHLTAAAVLQEAWERINEGRFTL